jgi:hypothetical protein
MVAVGPVLELGILGELMHTIKITRVGLAAIPETALQEYLTSLG